MAFAPVLASAKVQFSAETKGIETAIDRVGKVVAGTITRVMAVVGVVVAVFFLIQRVVRMLQRAIEDANHPLHSFAVGLQGVASAFLDGIYPGVVAVRDAIRQMIGSGADAEAMWDGLESKAVKLGATVALILIDVTTMLQHISLTLDTMIDSAAVAIARLGNMIGVVTNELVEALEGDLDERMRELLGLMEEMRARYAGLERARRDSSGGGRLGAGFSSIADGFKKVQQGLLNQDIDRQQLGVQRNISAEVVRIRQDIRGLAPRRPRYQTFNTEGF